jgi:hypothetical protein
MAMVTGTGKAEVAAVAAAEVVTGTMMIECKKLHDCPSVGR